MKEKFLKINTPFGGKNLGTIGTETPIVDKNGNQLKIGDVVLVLFRSLEGKFLCRATVIDDTTFIETDEECYPFGLFVSCDKQGNLDKTKIDIEKIKECDDIPVGFNFYIDDTTFIEYCTEEDTKE